MEKEKSLIKKLIELIRRRKGTTQIGVSDSIELKHIKKEDQNKVVWENIKRTNELLIEREKLKDELIYLLLKTQCACELIEQKDSYYALRLQKDVKEEIERLYKKINDVQIKLEDIKYKEDKNEKTIE